MMRKLIGAACLAGLVVAFSTSVSNAAVVIDPFNGALNVNVPGLGANPSATAGGNANPGILGGSRGVINTRHSGNNGQNLNIDPGGTGVFELSTGPDDIGSGFFQYDGDTNPNLLNATGLGGVDLTEAGANDLITLFYRADLAGAPVTVTVYTDAGNASRATFSTIATGFGANLFAAGDLPLASFTTLLGGGANFASVGAIEILVNGATGVSGLDIQIDSAQSRVIPEPASLTALLGGIALLARRRGR